MNQEILHSIILIITIACAFLFSKTPLYQYNLEISAFLFVILYLFKRVPIKNTVIAKIFDSTIFTFVITVIIISTGGTNSDFFFLNYFLLFSLSLLLEPIISITASLTLVISYLFISGSGQNNIQSFIPVLSLVLIAPFAMYLGQEYLELIKTKKEAQKLEEDSLLFLKIVIKNHAVSILEAAENFSGDHELENIKKHARRLKTLIEKYK